MPATPALGSARDATEDDHDLLTYGEVGARLAEQLDIERAELAELVRERGADDPVIYPLARRIDLLEEASERNHSRAGNLARFESVFGYRPDPRNR